MESLKYKLLKRTAGELIRKGQFLRGQLLDQSVKPESTFTLMYFCGANGLDYLNAALVSVYKSWTHHPKITIVTDGTPVDLIRDGMISWPKEVEIITWKEAFFFFQQRGESDLCGYATNNVWGKKLIGVLYVAMRSEVLYSDTDVLWFNEPRISINRTSDRYICMMQEASEACYDEKLLGEIESEFISDKSALNAGIMYLKGDFSSYPKWGSMFSYLNSNPDKCMGWSEQTVFALLSNYFNGVTFPKEEMLIDVTDTNNFFPGTMQPSVIARHYVCAKSWVFWRDYFFYFRLNLRNYRRSGPTATESKHII